jgi:hypothetical protein
MGLTRLSSPEKYAPIASFSFFKPPIAAPRFFSFETGRQNLWETAYAQIKDIVSKLRPLTQVEKINRQATRKGDKLIPQIFKMTEKLQRLDRFILDRPDLFRLFQLYLKEENKIGLPIPLDIVYFKGNELHSQDPIDRLVELTQVLNQVNYLWAERLRFIQRHPLVQELMFFYMKESHHEKSKHITFLEYHPSEIETE